MTGLDNTARRHRQKQTKPQGQNQTSKINKCKMKQVITIESKKNKK
jgi:hypothetical protein